MNWYSHTRCSRIHNAVPYTACGWLLFSTASRCTLRVCVFVRVSTERSIQWRGVLARCASHCRFLGERYLVTFALRHELSVCRLSVTLLHPQRLELFGNIYAPSNSTLTSAEACSVSRRLANTSFCRQLLDTRLLCCCSIHLNGTLYLLTFDCAITFSLSNATWKPIYSYSLSPPVLRQAPLYFRT